MQALLLPGYNHFSSLHSSFTFFPLNGPSLRHSAFWSSRSFFPKADLLSYRQLSLDWQLDCLSDKWLICFTDFKSTTGAASCICSLTLMVGNYRRNKTEFRPGHLLGLSFNVIINESFPQPISLIIFTTSVPISLLIFCVCVFVGVCYSIYFNLQHC